MAGHLGGVIQLADFGISGFHHTNTRSNLRLDGNTKTYRAPESELEDGQKVSRSIDIWSLGCVFLEFITWVVLGKPETFIKVLGAEKMPRDLFSFKRDTPSSVKDITQDTFYSFVKRTLQPRST